MPGPLSATEIIALPSRDAPSVQRIRPPSGVNLKAFESRLITTRSVASRSSSAGSGAVRSSNTISIGGYEVNRSLFWLGLAGAAIAGGVVLDNVPESASNGELDGLDFVPAGLYTLGGIFLIGAF